MMTRKATVYICEHCGKQYPSSRQAQECQQQCKDKLLTRQQWYAANPPKYKQGDIVQRTAPLTVAQVAAVNKGPKSYPPCWHYRLITEDAGIIDVPQCQLLLVMQSAHCAAVMRTANKLLKDFPDKKMEMSASWDVWNKPTPELHITIKIPDTVLRSVLSKSSEADPGQDMKTQTGSQVDQSLQTRIEALRKLGIRVV